jgi:hypothetical protein
MRRRKSQLVVTPDEDNEMKTSIPPSTNPFTSAERMRRHRERRREGLTHVSIDLRGSEIDGLVRLGFLSTETRNDVTAIRKGLYQYFQAMLDTNRGAATDLVTEQQGIVQHTEKVDV